jgi:hypothetical protein
MLSLFVQLQICIFLDLRFVAEIGVLMAAALPYGTLGVGAGRQVSLRVRLSFRPCKGGGGVKRDSHA